MFQTVAYPGILFGGVQQIQLRTEDRENRVLEAAVIFTRNFISYSEIFLLLGTLDYL